MGTGAELLRRTYRQVRGPQVESHQQPWPVSVHGAEIIQSHNLTDFQQVAFKTECFQVIFSICLCCSGQSKCFPVYSHALFIDPLRAADMGWSLQSAVCVCLRTVFSRVLLAVASSSHHFAARPLTAARLLSRCARERGARVEKWAAHVPRGLSTVYRPT